MCVRVSIGGLPGVPPSRPGDTTIRRARRDDARERPDSKGFSGAAARGAGPRAAEKGWLPRVIVGRACRS